MILEEGATGKGAGVVLGSFFGGRGEWTQFAFVFFFWGGGGGGGCDPHKNRKVTRAKNISNIPGNCWAVTLFVIGIL